MSIPSPATAASSGSSSMYSENQGPWVQQEPEVSNSVGIKECGLNTCSPLDDKAVACSKPNEEKLPSTASMKSQSMAITARNLAARMLNKRKSQFQWWKDLSKERSVEKVRKGNVPLRPIISLRGTLMYSLAKWVSGRLKFLAAGSPTTVASANQFLERIKHLKLEPDESMVSFDVIWLFTSIPQQLTIDAADRLLAERYD
nr:unnamed protein product [Spirometra erinaceieuropaei]